MTLLTEEEAREKWCPKSMAIGYYEIGHGVTTNRDRQAIKKDVCNCIGADCMAWRWVQIPDWVAQFNAAIGSDAPGRFVEAIKIYRQATGLGLKEAKEFCDNVRNGVEPKPTEGTAPLGYCGAFGRPE